MALGEVEPQDLMDESKIGSQQILTGMTPVFKYIDGVRTDEIIGYKYEASCPSLRLNKIGVKIDGDLLLDESALMKNVRFEGIEPYLYTQNDKVKLGFRAENVELLGK